MIPSSAASALRRSPDISRRQLFRLVTGGRPVRDALSSHTVFRCRYHLSGDGTAALIAAMVGAAPGIIITIIALPLRHGLLAIKAHAALISEGAAALGQFAGIGHVTCSEGEPVHFSPYGPLTLLPSSKFHMI